MKLVTPELGVPQQSTVQLAGGVKRASSGSALRERIVTPKMGVPQPLSIVQVAKWVLGTGSSSKVSMKDPTQNPQITHTTKTPPKNIKDGEISMQVMRKLTYLARSKPAEAQQRKLSMIGKKHQYFPPIIKNRVTIVKLNLDKVEKQQRKWDCALIGYVVGKNPLFKQILYFVYTFWKHL